MDAQNQVTDIAEGLSPGVVIATTLDTKQSEIVLLLGAFERHGLGCILIDCGVLGSTSMTPSISASQIAALAGSDLEDLRRRQDREAALQVMMTGLSLCLDALVGRGLVRGFFAMGGGTNTALASAAFARLPYGLPKLLVATTVSGDMSRIVDAKDVVLVHSVVDILGTGEYLRALLGRSAAVMKTLVAEAETPHENPASVCVGITAFGSTTLAANAAFERFRAAGLDALVFHARGSGGRAAETFIRDGHIDLMLDLTTTEIADEVVGGRLSAGPGRLDAAVEKAIPQVILPGAIDMVNFGPLETVPARFHGRNFIRHTPSTTLMRTSASEAADVARFIAGKLEGARSPVVAIIPMRGFSAYDAEGAPFFDPAADRAFIDTFEQALRRDIPVIKIDAHINDPAVSELAADTLLQLAENQK
ncbi:uncharacterized protein (UPF0261 family) [Rhizobium sp. ERR 1071]|uniref:Tm-1-like ATP-binding domain-containing protein n=1 Tax=Rhizobium sp. ERR 1071 TaxID=2572677 RepID=UPI00119B68F9|nr:Tm-1-like ATP-binding domain-containing protein [Rhizobium sp. ERR1071]TWB08696.1 uncharacterized protein (UPF0261 family) [Rhizobium sp. ERR1071]